ncbi:chromosome alignment-maintaining phosphoprotein 1 [Sarotherodon galilaeus]
MSENRITNYQSLTPGGCVAEWGKTVRHMNRLVVYLGLLFKTMLPPHRHPAALFPQLLGVCRETASGAYAIFGCTSYRGLASYGHSCDTRCRPSCQLKRRRSRSRYRASWHWRVVPPRSRLKLVVLQFLR